MSSFILLFGGLMLADSNYGKELEHKLVLALHGRAHFENVAIFRLFHVVLLISELVKF